MILFNINGIFIFWLIVIIKIMKNIIPYGKQTIDQKDKKYVAKSLSNQLITTGPLVLKFEQELKNYLGSKYTKVCSSGTSALHLAMLSVGVKKNDVVLIPAINFIASYNIASLMEARIFLVDVDKETGQITPETILNCIKKNKIKKIKVLLTMHHGGYPENIINIYKLKKKFKFFLIEDACHSLGASYLFNKKLIKVGSCSHADISTFSLHPVKSITTGEGGIISTNNKKLNEKIKLYRSHGIKKNKLFYWKYDVLVNGLNYRISDINCALGISQLKKIDKLILRRKKCYKIYLDKFKNFNVNLKLPKYSIDIRPSYHLAILNINFKKLKKNKDHFIKYLNKKNIFPQFHYIPIYNFSVFNSKKKIMLDQKNIVEIQLVYQYSQN